MSHSPGMTIASSVLNRYFTDTTDIVNLAVLGFVFPYFREVNNLVTEVCRVRFMKGG